MYLAVPDKSTSLYEKLMLLNQHCEAVKAILRTLSIEGMISRKDATYYGLMVEEARSSSSQCIVENLDEREVQLAGRASKSRLSLEKKLFGT